MVRIGDEQALSHVLSVARLSVADEHRGAVLAAAEMFYGQLDLLDGVPHADTAPATTFDARWT